MSTGYVPVAYFPATIWDGSSRFRPPSQNPRLIYKDPNADDWNQIVSEVIALQQNAGLVPKPGGQTIYLGSGPGDSGSIYSTSDASRGNLILNSPTTYIDFAGRLFLGSNPATVGNIALPQSGSIYYRNNANNANLRLLECGKFDGSTNTDSLSFGAGTSLSIRAGTQIFLTSTNVNISTTTVTQPALSLLGISGQTGPMLALQQLTTVTPTSRNCGIVDAVWATSADSTRMGRLLLKAGDATTLREGLRIESNGTVPMLGFYGATAIVKPAPTGSRAGNAALASLLTSLASLGLITDSTSA